MFPPLDFTTLNRRPPLAGHVLTSRYCGKRIVLPVDDYVDRISLLPGGIKTAACET